MKPLFKKSFFFPVVLFVVSAFLILLAEISQSRSKFNAEQAVTNAEKNLQHLEKKMAESLEEISTISNDSTFHSYFIHHGFQNLGFSFFYVEKEKITKWSDNETEINSQTVDTCKNNSLIHLNNGWYEIFIQKENGKEIIGLLLIRKEYAYENKYLVNGFNPLLVLPSNAVLVNGHDENSFVVRSGIDQPLFYIRLNNPSGESMDFNFKSWLYLVSLLLALLASFFVARIFFKRSSPIALLIIPVMIAVRMFMIYFQMPDEFYGTEFFSPRYYASSFYFNSPGDLFINSLIILCVSGIFYSFFSEKSIRIKNKSGLEFIRAGVLVLAGLLFLPLNTLISGLIMNSKISFDVNDLFGMNGYSLLSFFVIAVLLASYFLITFALLKAFFRDTSLKFFSKQMLFPLFVFGIISFLLRQQSQSLSDVLLLILFSGSVILVSLLNSQKKIRLNFLLYITLFFSIYSSALIWKLNDEKEKENRKLLAQKIETGRDQAAEYLFEDAGQKISNDPFILRHFRDSLHVQEQVSKRLLQIYFTGYWSKFDVSIYCFNRDGFPFDSLRTKLLPDSLIKGISSEQNQNNPQLYYLSKESEPQQYFALIPLVRKNEHDSLIGSIVVLFTPKLFQSNEGFQELFVSSKVAFNKELSNYSFARYQNDSLMNQSGKFAYYFSLEPFHPSQQEYSFVDLDGFSHLLYRISGSSFIIVSRNKESILVPFTLFSYLFSFFSLLMLLFYVLLRVMNRKIEYHISLTRRIQLSVMLLVILSFVLIGSSTVYYITHKYDVDKDESISEKINPLLSVIEKELGDATNLNNRLSDETQASFIRLSNSRDAHFNLFNPEGNLSYSSQPKIFERGIISQKMNPEALFEISEKGKTQFVQQESIGNLTYTAAYEPFRNRQGKMIGYLHLPYFEKQNELNKEISGFLSSLINIYILLLALAVMVTLFISARVTQPLLLIQEKLSNIKLGRKNELIEYRQRDEIGELVNEYNRMVDELSASAEKLARSERESAWREMAKQVAHEIKNPLTPMKLSVQHLQKAWEEKSPQLNEIFQRIAKTLVEQIDTLSSIATEFSNFAQMPQPKKENVDLDKILKSTIDLFKELPDISIAFSGDEQSKFVFADKDQLIRLFSNLLKNAAQAISSGKQGIILVSVSSSGNSFVISIQDNGAGISEEQVAKIFTPSFTTKSGGMGLGLSIAKNIVESSGGTIRFETEKEKGTTFFISLPSIQKNI